MHVIIPIEIKKREFDAKSWLGGFLAADGHRVTVGQHKIINENLRQLDPDIYIGLGAVNRARKRKRFETLKEVGSKIFVLDTEGGAFGSPGEFSSHVSPEILRYVDVYLAWGERSATVARDVIAENGLSTDVVVSGNPRFDLLHPDLAELYRDKAESYKTQYGEFLLINTNFSVNHVDRASHEDSALGEVRTIYRKQSRLLSEFITLIYHIDAELDEYNIVLRPHPSEDHSVYQTLLGPFEDVYIDDSGEVQPWLLASEAVIHNSCTTGMEAVLMRQPAFSYLDEFYDEHISNSLSTSVNDIHELVERFDNFDKIENSETNLESLQQFIANTDDKSAVEIRETIREMDQPSAGTRANNDWTVAQSVGARVYQMSPGAYRQIRNSQYSPEHWTYTSYRCGTLSVAEIKENIRRYNEWYDHKVAVEQYSYTENLFCLERATSDWDQ